jgi:signal transduction histidine kinase
MSDERPADYASHALSQAPLSTRIACSLGVIAFVSFAAVDPFATENPPLATLYTARAIVVALLIGIFLFSYSGAGRRMASALAAVACAVIGAGVVAVTVLVGGAATTYHEALLLTYFGFALLPLNWKTWFYAAMNVSLSTLWLVAVVVSGQTGTPGQMISASGILLVATVIATTLASFGRGMRERDFEQRATIAEAMVRLSALDRAKNRFFANLSHEFRTPLTLSLAPLESLLESNRGQLTAMQVRHVELARRSGLRLLKLVDDLLVLSRLEAASLPLNRKNLDLGAVVSMLVEESSPLAARKGIRLTHAVPQDNVSVAADPDAVERILLNLLSNALHFTKAGGTVHVRLEHEGAFAYFEVADSGVGIASEDIENVFDRFHQGAQDPGSQNAGAGIGLSLVRELVQVHGGRIEVRSSVGHGTTMQVWLPSEHPSVAGEPVFRPSLDFLDSDELRAAAPGTDAPVKSEGDPDGISERGMPEWHDALRRTREYRLMGVERATERRRTPRAARDDGSMARLLVVEDNLDLVRYIGELLSSSYSVMSATDGASAIRIAHQFVPDLIMCDLMLPAMSGYDVITQLRASSVTRHIPVVVLSARQDTESRTYARSHGADAFIGKPFHVSELLATVQSLLERVGLSRDLVRRETQELTHGLVTSLAGSLRGQVQQLQAALTQVSTENPDARPKLLAAVRPLETLSERVAMVVGTDLETPVDQELDVLVRNAVSSLKQPSGVQLQLKLRADVVFFVRTQAMTRAVIELIKNVFDFAGPRARILVETEVSPDGSFLLRIEDNGPGVPHEQRDRVFQPFFSTQPDVHAGLGLTIARDVAFAHHGTLVASDGRVLGGAAFVMRLPSPPESRAGTRMLE